MSKSGTSVGTLCAEYYNFSSILGLEIQIFLIGSKGKLLYSGVTNIRRCKKQDRVCTNQPAYYKSEN